MEPTLYLRFLLALVFVIGLIGGLAYLVRRFGLGGRMIVNTGRARRLSILEVQPIDARHKLVLLRRDSTDHLVLIGPNQPLLVERGIPDDGETAAAASFAAQLDREVGG